MNRTTIAISNPVERPALGIGLRIPSGFLFAAMVVPTALALIMVRLLNRTESSGAIALYFVVVSMIGEIATLPWGWVVPNATTLAPAGWLDPGTFASALL